MKTVSDFKNDLLNRREIKLVFEAEKNPGFSGGKEKIIEQFKVKDDLIVVRGVKSKFGRNTFLVDAFVYDSAEALKKFEPKSKTKNGEEEAKANSPVPAAAPAEAK